jgi:MFS family permease
LRPPDFVAHGDLDGKWRALVLLCACEVMALALWFSASAVVPALTAEFGLGATQGALLSSAVAFGYVAGTFLSAYLNLADRLDPRRFFAAAAIFGAAANATVLAVDPAGWLVVLLRFLTGFSVAGVYPVGMKMASTWAKGDMGLLIGILIGALTLGSAAPHLFNAYGGVDWRRTIALASASAALAAVIISWTPLGPARVKAPPFDPRRALDAWRDKPLRLANLGYYGHMWELYAMWAWIGVFLHASFSLRGEFAAADAALYAKLAAFAVIAAGALGCGLGGWLADRYGRTTVTMGAMAVSGGCALAIGWLFGGDPVLVTVLAVVWGISVVADSAQFSASVIELADKSYVGTMLTVQTCIGFLLTTATIHLIPPLVAGVGWRYAFAALAIGPFLGVWAMARLRADPASLRLAGGNR